MSIVAGDLTSLAFCWRLERRDGVAIGFTTHDRDLTIDHLTYRAAPGMVPSAVSLSDGFDAAPLEIAGSLTSDAITESDLRAGRWDGAAVAVFMVDWQNVEGERIPLARGELGDVSWRGAAFTADLRGPAAVLERPVVEQTSPQCRAELGDKRCRVDMAARVRLTRVAAVPAEDELVLEDAADDPNAYGYGRLRWLTGRNSGLESPVLASVGAKVTLREQPAFPAEPGDLVEIKEGCDRNFGTCRTRFSNSENFRGEPHLPGTDLLTRYPGA
jgi:uncharacterized phage protein (TIGR02218 family)